MKEKETSWVNTDPDNEQYGRKLHDGHYEFKEKDRFNEEEEWIIIDILLSMYTEEQIENHVSAYYCSLAELKEQCGDDWEWIVAECIFEQESGLY